MADKDTQAEPGRDEDVVATPETDEHDRLFAEISTGPANTTEDTPPPDAGDDEDPSGDDGGDGEEGEAPGDAPAGDAPAADDPWANAPELKRLYDEEHQRRKSAEGRIAALQRRPAPRDAGNRTEGADPLAKHRQKFQELTQEYPEFATPMVAAIDDLSREVGRMTDAERAAFSRQAAEQEAIFTAAHPDGFDIIGNPDDPARFDRAKHAAFVAWVDDQPKSVRDAVASMATAITDGETAAQIFTAYKASLGPAEEPPAPRTDPLAGRRRSQLAGARTTTARSPRASDAPPDGDHDKLFDYYAAKSERRR